MAYAAVTSLMGTLSQYFLQPQPRFPLQYKQHLVSLHENLGFLQKVLEESEIATYDNSGLKDLEAEMRDAAFEIEERIEMEMTTIYLAKRWAKRIASVLRLHGIFIQAVKQTDYLNKKLKIKTEKQLAKGPSQGQRMGQRPLLLGSTSSQPDPERENITVSTFSKNASIKFHSRMVGYSEEFNKMIMDQLNPQFAQQRLKVVLIVGMGGIGKTTLARKFYEDSSITSHFDKKAWVTVTQKHNAEQMLQCLVDCVNATSNVGLHEQRYDNLAESLRKCLKDHRYLIVIDDIWSEEAWGSVQRCFPDDNNGSRILLTSRLREVAEYANSGNSTINMPFLDANESWNLFCNVFGQTKFISVFEEIGREIVNKCGGLPLAIIVVASLLSKTEVAVEKWNNVAENVSRYVNGYSNDACSRILNLSYNQLPHHLKVCFLYFGVFPEDYEIHVKKLVRLWAAEGFLKADHRNMEEVAMECLQDLVDRSLVFVSKRSYNGIMKTVRMHDLLRDLCLREAQHENLLNVIRDEKLPFPKEKISCRWIRAASGLDLLPLTMCFHKLHSLHSPYSYYSSVKPLFSHFKLRVVDIFSNGYEELINALGNLIHLRYLALRYSTNASPKNFYYLKLFEHWNMQSVTVRGADDTFCSFEASAIWKMPLLRNLCIERIVSLETLSSVVHRNLESISWLHPKLCTEDLFTRIPNLKKLGINGRKCENNLDCFKNFVHLRQLEELSIREWWNLNHILCSEIPWATSFLPNLKKLKFIDTNLAWSDMRLIGMLPNLEVLKLKDAIAREYRMWEPSKEGFRQLKRLVIHEGCLEHWSVAGDNFPMLECLELRHCDSLHGIPLGFVNIITLTLIQLNWCWDSVLASAKFIEEEQYSHYGNVLLVRSENIMKKPVSNKRGRE